MSEIWEAIQTNFVIILMVTARVSGIFTFNPIFSRNGVPNMVKAGASLMLALVMAAAGVNLMLQLFSLAGELSDYQIGLSMARSYDPTFGTTSLVTQYYSWWFMIYFFMVGGHLSYIKLFFISYESIPMGFSSFNFNVGLLIVKYFETVLTLGLKLAMPVIAAGLVTEFCIGVLMKAVPSIHVFVLNVQIKMLVGFVVLAGCSSMVSEFMEKIMDLLFSNLNTLLGEMAV